MPITAEGQINLLNAYTTGNFKVMLLLGADAILPNALPQEYFRREVKVAGYQRPSVSFTMAEIFWDSSTSSNRFPVKNLTVTAGAVPIQFDGMVLIKDGHSVANTQILSASGDWFTPAAQAGTHLSTGLFTTSGTMPTGLTAGTPYTMGWGNSASSNTVNPFALDDIPVTNNFNYGSSWTGVLTWHSMIGKIYPPFVLRPPDGQGSRVYTIQPNQSHTLSIDFGLGIK